MHTCFTRWLALHGNSQARLRKSATVHYFVERSQSPNLDLSQRRFRNYCTHAASIHTVIYTIQHSNTLHYSMSVH